MKRRTFLKILGISPIAAATAVEQAKAAPVQIPTLPPATGVALTKVDEGKWVVLNNSPSITYTLPRDSIPHVTATTRPDYRLAPEDEIVTFTTSHPARMVISKGSKRYQIAVLQLGTGQVTLVAGTGVTLRFPGSQRGTLAQYSRLVLDRIGDDVWIVDGDLG